MENRRKQKTNYIISAKICMIKMKCKKKVSKRFKQKLQAEKRII